MPRFISAKPDIGLIQLPWYLPLAEWPDTHLVALPQGISRHVVRFIKVKDQIYAAKEILEHLAVGEYRMLTDLNKLNIPAVKPVGVVTARKDSSGKPLDTILLTKHLQFSIPYRTLFHAGVRSETVSRLLDAMVVLLARLHLIGFLWGDVSLSNVLFRRDAGSYAAYLVDAETSEIHDKLSDGQRLHDIQIARTNLYGEFLDLEAGGLLDESLDPLNLVRFIEARYHELWSELTAPEEFPENEISRLEGRVRRLNALGFDVAELDITTSRNSENIRIQPKVVEAGHHSRRLLRLTGLDTEENQARRLLNDLDTYRACTRQNDEEESLVAHKWVTEVFEPVIETIPLDMRAKREPAQFFHEVLDHRWYLSQNQHRAVPLIEAARDYVHEFLSALPDEKLATDLESSYAKGHKLIDPSDPSKGFIEEEEEPEPVDPWESFEAEDAKLETNILDMDTLRAHREARKKY